MTEQQRKMVSALAGCRFLPGSFEKRFVRSLVDREGPLTSMQEKRLRQVAHSYRKQVGKCLDDACEKCEKRSLP